MAFQQKEWKNRLSENPTRRLLTPVDGSASFQVDVTRAEGTILQQGDPFNADNMNDLEQRIADAVGGGDINMAPIEEGPESANPYVENDLLIYGGQLYRVIDAIAVGNSFVEGVNIETTTLSDEIKDIQDELTANGTRLYMDYKNGKYGYNTSPARGADTFHPFKSSPIVVGTFTGSSPNVNVDIHQAITNAGYDYTSLTNDDFIIQATGSSASGGNASGWYGTSVTIGKSYNASTGVMTVTGVNASTPTQPNGSVSVSVSGNILLIG